jgi:hypothetical protein
MELLPPKGAQMASEETWVELPREPDIDIVNPTQCQSGWASIRSVKPTRTRRGAHSEGPEGSRSVSQGQPRVRRSLALGLSRGKGGARLVGTVLSGSVKSVRSLDRAKAGEAHYRRTPMTAYPRSRNGPSIARRQQDRLDATRGISDARPSAADSRVMLSTKLRRACSGESAR